MKPVQIINTITIKAPASKVWDALVNPEQTKKYMFGCEAQSAWKKGSTLIWKMEKDGKTTVPVKGHIVEIEPDRLLSYTVIDPHNPNIPDLPENYLVVTYKLDSKGSETILSVAQGDYSTVADGPRRYEEAYNNGKGWDPILQQIKAILE